MNVFKIPVHEAADVFPMLQEDELKELAEDIKANGQHQPIIIKDGVLIDGRNRLAACKIAGVEPIVQELDGQDPVAYILSANINRRHLTKGQRAMAVAMIYPEKGRGKSPTKLEFNAETLRKAREVLRILPELAKQVRDGNPSLNEAYEKAKSYRQSSEYAAECLARLRKEAPDLADLVEEERMTLPEAIAAYEARKQQEKNDREAVYSLLERQKMLLESFDAKRVDHLVKIFSEHPEECSIADLKKLSKKMIAAGEAILGGFEK